MASRVVGALVCAGAGILLGGCAGSDSGGSLPGACPAIDADSDPRIETELERAWALADPEVLVRVIVDLVEQPTLESFAGTDTPTEAQRVAFEAYVREELQACTVALVELSGGTVEGQFAVSGSAVLARVNRVAGLDLGRFPDVALVSGVGVLPPPAGSEQCSDLSQVGCEERSDCALVRGAVYDDESACAHMDTPVGCASADLSGGGQPQWATTPAGQCVYFETNLVPTGFGSGDACPSGEPDSCE